MAFCASGPGVPKPAADESYNFDPQYFCSLLPPLYSWICPYLPYMPPIHIDTLSVYCAVDPPDPPTIDGTILSALLSGSGTAQYINAALAVGDVLHRYIWSLYCQCPAGDTTPAAPAAQSDPGGLPAVNEGGGANGGTVTPCGSVADPGLEHMNPGESLELVYSYNPRIHGETSIVVTTTNTSGPSSFGGLLAVACKQYDHANVVIRTDSFNVSYPHTNFAKTLTVEPLCERFTREDSVSSGSAFGVHFIRKMEGYCNHTYPGGTVQPCCPPDATLQAQLYNIMSLLTVVQKQAAPYGYRIGNTHVDLVDNGYVTTLPLLGLTARLTTVPSVLGDRAGEPPRLFNAGWVQLGTADGYGEPWFLSSATMLIVPPLGGVYTRIAYSLHPGVVLELTELRPERTGFEGTVG